MRIQYGHDLGLGNLRVHELEHRLEQPELLSGQIGFGENLGFYKAVIRNQQLAKQISRAQPLAKLAVSVAHKGQLHAQRKPLGVSIKLFQKGVFLELFQQ